MGFESSPYDYDDMYPEREYDGDEYEEEDDFQDSDDDFAGAYDDEEYLIDGVGFADPGGHSSLRAATRSNPRDQPCPSCGAEDVLTRKDVQRHYVCDRCADIAEGKCGY